MRCLLGAAIGILIALPAEAQLAAFPGAEGYGRLATGGRAGTVFHITNLNDSGAGSFRACVEATGARTCVFDVGGTITSTGTAFTISNPNITIAGETAPPPGITLKRATSLDGDPLTITASNVIIRFIGFESGRRQSGGTSATRDGIAIESATASDIILDHISARYGVDEVISVFGCDVTVQNSLLAWGLWDAGHVEGVHSKIMLADNQTAGCDISVLRTLMTSSFDRMPDVNSWDNMQIVNVYMYNAQSEFGEYRNRSGVSKLDVISSRCKAGPSTQVPPPPCINDRTDDGTINDFSIYYTDVIATTIIDPLDVSEVTGTPHSMPTIATVWPASTLDTNLLPRVGRTLPIRDRLDHLAVQQVLEGTGSILSQAAGQTLPQLTVTRAASDAELQNFVDMCCDWKWRTVDSDGDGIPDLYEVKHPTLSETSSADGATLAASGYSYLEEYLHTLAATAP